MENFNTVIVQYADGMVDIGKICVDRGNGHARLGRNECH